MVAATLVLLSVLLVVLAGEAVRVQCRRMLTQPARVHDAGTSALASVGREVAA